MQLQSLTAISPIDGRYRYQLQHLDEYFSEFALIKYRVKVEVAYFLFLAEKKFFKITPALKKQLLKIIIYGKTRADYQLTMEIFMYLIRSKTRY